MTDAERIEGEAVLRDLAKGGSVQSIPTEKLPPLADTMGIVAAHDALLRSTERAARLRRRRYVALGATVAVLALYTALRSRASAGTRPPAAAASSAPQTAAPVATTVQAPPPSTPVVPATQEKPARESVTTPHVRARRHADSLAAAAAAAPVDTTPGKVRLRALPGDAVILIDGREMGSGILLDVPLLPGHHAVRIVDNGYQSFDTTLTIAPGQTTIVPTITLKDASAGAKP